MKDITLEEALVRNDRRLAIELFVGGFIAGVLLTGFVMACIANAGGFL